MPSSRTVESVSVHPKISRGTQPSGQFGPDGYDRDGYDRDGFDRLGRDRAGYDRQGLSRYGYDREGFNLAGFDAQGQHRNDVLPIAQRRARIQSGQIHTAADYIVLMETHEARTRGGHGPILIDWDRDWNIPLRDAVPADEVAELVSQTIEQFIHLNPTLDQVFALIRQNGGTTPSQINMMVRLKERAYQVGLVRNAGDYVNTMSAFPEHVQPTRGYHQAHQDLLMITFQEFMDGPRRVAELAQLRRFIQNFPFQGDAFVNWGAQCQVGLQVRVTDRAAAIRQATIQALVQRVNQLMQAHPARVAQDMVFKYYLINPPALDVLPADTNCMHCFDDVDHAHPAIRCRHEDVDPFGARNRCENAIHTHLRTELVDHVFKEVSSNAGRLPVTCGGVPLHQHEIDLPVALWVQMKASLDAAVPRLHQEVTDRYWQVFDVGNDRLLAADVRRLSQEMETREQRIAVLEAEIAALGTEDEGLPYNRVQVQVMGQQVRWRREPKPVHPNRVRYVPIQLELTLLQNGLPDIRNEYLLKKELLDKRDLRNKWDAFKERWELQTLYAYYRHLNVDEREGEHYQFCNEPGCGIPQHRAHLQANGHIHCNNCHGERCFQCDFYHPGQTCAQAAAARNGDVEMNRLLHDPTSTVRPCPYCMAPTHRTEACFHMDCPSCGSKWNWQFGRLRETSGVTTWGADTLPRLYRVPGDADYVEGGESAYPIAEGRVVRVLRGTYVPDLNYNPAVNRGFVVRPE